MAKYMVTGYGEDGDETIFFDTLEQAKALRTKHVYLVTEIHTKERLNPEYEYKETKL